MRYFKKERRSKSKFHADENDPIESEKITDERSSLRVGIQSTIDDGPFIER